MLFDSVHGVSMPLTDPVHGVNPAGCRPTHIRSHMRVEGPMHGYTAHLVGCQWWGRVITSL